MMNKIRSEDTPAYKAEGSGEEDAIVAQALSILWKRMKQPGEAISCPDDTRKYLTLKLMEKPYEVFSVVWLDNRHRTLAFDEMFQGTIDGASVHPREVVRAAIKHNAAACILTHNHPSGMAEPSQEDIQITKRLKEALAFIDVRVLDHVIVGWTPEPMTISLAERGLV